MSSHDTLVAAVFLLLASCAGAQKLAIIGGGVAGAAASYYARQQLGEGVEITVFERDQLGGRARELNHDGLILELGASMVWGKNYLVRDLTAAAGLQRESPDRGSGGEGGLFAVYDGRELVFAESSWRIVTLLRLLWRYWFTWFTFRGAPAATFDKFQGIYTLLDSGSTFDRPTDLLKAVGLYDLTQQSMFEFLRVTYGTDMDLLGSELIAGVNRCNYNQGNMELNALAGMVSMLPATEPSVFRIKGGNSQLAPRLLEWANASVRCPAEVGAVRLLPSGRFVLEAAPAAAAAEPAAKPTAASEPARPAACAAAEAGCEQAQAERALAQHVEQQDPEQREQGAGSGGELGEFDAVIIATPLESSGLSLSGFKRPVIPARKYRQTISTFVKGSVRPSYFGLTEMTYSAVLVADAAQLPWSALGLAGRTAHNATVWKLFSTEPVPHAWLSMMFEAGFEVVASKAWDAPGAYPAFDPPEDFAPFKLAEGLYYAAALENAASAMEVAAIEGRLVAQMAAQHISSKASKAAGTAVSKAQEGQASGEERTAAEVQTAVGEERAAGPGQRGRGAAAVVLAALGEGDGDGEGRQEVAAAA